MPDHIFFNTVEGIKQEFAELYENEEFVVDKTGKKVVEILAAQFMANETSIFGKVSDNYLKQELDWYLSQSANINDMAPPIPELWKSTANLDGNTNSNYGRVILHESNFKQYEHVRFELAERVDSRRAIMIYTRPSMWVDYNMHGKNDFMCTNSVQYFIRKNQLHAYVSMRSNDAVFGYKCDYYWQKYVLDKLHYDLIQVYPKLTVGSIIWNVGSLHVYERHFYLIARYLDGEK